MIKIADINSELLWSLYWGNGYALPDIGDIFDCNQITILNRMKEYSIPRRSASLHGELTNFTFNDVQKEILDGLMLGDGHLAWRINNCQFNNTDVHKDYLVWLQKQLGIEDISNVAVRTDGLCQLTTRVIPSIRDEHKRWYPYNTMRGTYQNHDKKVIPKDIELTPIKMLFWYIGDGSYIRDRATAIFCNCLTFDEWLSLSKKICRLLDVDNGTHIWKESKDKDGIQKHILCLNRSVTQKFFNMIDDLSFDIPECYQYKFGKVI